MVDCQRVSFLIKSRIQGRYILQLAFADNTSDFSFLTILLCSSSDEQVSDAVDPVIKMEEGILTKAGYDSDTTDRMLMECLKKQRRGSQGYPENALVDSEDDDVVEQEDYLREKMKKQRRLSQGYADGSGSSDEESTMVEINLNEDLCSSGN